MLGLPLGALSLGLAVPDPDPKTFAGLVQGAEQPADSSSWCVRTASRANTIVGRTAEPAAGP